MTPPTSPAPPAHFIIAFPLPPEHIPAMYAQISAIYGDSEVHLSHLDTPAFPPNHWLFIDRNGDVPKSTAILQWIKSHASVGDVMQPASVIRIGSAMTMNVGLPSKAASCSAIARKRPDYVL